MTENGEKVTLLIVVLCFFAWPALMWVFSITLVSFMVIGFIKYYKKLAEWFNSEPHSTTDTKDEAPR
jgi:hypothetical protein